jgi:hypothetical protein
MRRYFWALVVLLAGCAGQRAPEGGPVDTDPPVVVSTIPPNYTTRFTGTSITLEFNEYVDHRSVEGALFVSPSVGPLTFDWSGREIEISFAGPLRRSTTYVVTIGTDVVDLNNRNKLAQAHTLAFSTGEDIDHGAIEGRVYPRQPADSPQGVTILAYHLKDINPDTLDPRSTLPDYVTQSGKGGEFFLKHLAFGTYRVIALRDEYKNLLYDPEVDDVGVMHGDIALTPHDTLRSHVWIRMFREETTAVRLLRVVAQNSHLLRAEFSSPLSPKISPSWFRITDTLTSRELAVVAAAPVFPGLTSVLLSTAAQESDKPYRLVVDSVRSGSGLAMNPLASASVFSGTDAPDTTGIGIASCSVEDSTKRVDLDAIIFVHFTFPVQRNVPSEAISLLDSGKVVIPCNVHWLSDATVQLKPVQPLRSKVLYSLLVDLERFVDYWGRAGKDTLLAFRFQTIDRSLFSTIEGGVKDTGADQAGPVRVVARNAASSVGKEYEVRLDRAGPFVLQDIPEGKYILSAYRDRNGDGQYNIGRVVPFKPSERFTQYADTLKLRARWPLEGVTMWLR